MRYREDQALLIDFASATQALVKVRVRAASHDADG